MSDTVKTFADVFRKVPFSRSVVAGFGNAEVCRVSVNRSAQTMLLQMNHGEAVSESCLDSLKTEMKAQFPAMKEIVVNLSRAGEPAREETAEEEQRLEEPAGRHVDGALRDLGALSPVCAKILEGAGRRFQDGALVLSVRRDYMYLLSKKGADEMIQDMLRRRTGCSFRVAFEGAAEGETLSKPAAPAPPELAPAPSSPILATVPPKPVYQKDFIDKKRKGRRGMKLAKAITGVPARLTDALVKDADVFVEGTVVDSETRETKKGRILVSFDMTDKTDSVTVKFFTTKEKLVGFEPLLAPGAAVAVNGRVQYDEFSKELNIMAWEMATGKPDEAQRADNAPVKRVELHLHTRMSAMDAMNPISDYIRRAAQWGHKAVALTDHGVAQAYPDAMAAAKNAPVKVLYGVEAYLIDDLGAVAQCPRGQTMTGDFVVFDLETTGLNKNKDHIIEIGAVKLKGGVAVDTFSTFVDPGVSIPEEITKLTGIGDDMVRGAPPIGAALPAFLAFAGDAVLVAHNASFDVGFVSAAAKRQGAEVNNTSLCTVELSRTLFPELGKHKLNVVAEHLGVPLENHHRAVDDARAAAGIFQKCAVILAERGAHTLEDVNRLAGQTMNKSKLRHTHAVIFAKNQTGLRNLYELISLSHLNYFYKRPRIPKSELTRLRDGLLLGTACDAGEFYMAVKDGRPDDHIRQLAEFYDYFEIQPVGNSMHLVRDGQVGGAEDLMEINRKIVALGERFRKPVAATGDVHFLEPEDEAFRRIIMAGEGFTDADSQPPLYYRTTEEMLAEFDYLGAEKACEVVVTNTNKIAELIGDVQPIPDGTFPPFIEGAEEEIEAVTMARAREIYSDKLPLIVEERLCRELDSIIKNGFSVMYVIARKLVTESMENGYLVGSRGSVGSSLVATMAGITEVNPLAPHYVCKSCKYSDFESDAVKSFAGASGCDMPDATCPVCGAALAKDGHDIPFETFLGFDGDKEPDIDLNFSGEYQARAHAHTEKLFGAGNVFKAGTISTLADKTAYGYVKKYVEEKGLNPRKAEINRLKTGCAGVKKTTGQHPGGLVVLPQGRSIYEFCPVQRPANDTSSHITTTHFDYHSIEGRLLKLDLLGHDVPTIARMLHDLTGVDPRDVDLGDRRVLSLFQSPEALGLTPEEAGCPTGTLGLPEFGTGFVRGMLTETRPESFSELVRISGLSHGTDVWVNNAQDLVKNGVATLKEIIPTRDDIMVYLIGKGVERKTAFRIMERVRKGKGLASEDEEAMTAADVPAWYIDSCKKIKYMFPKGHAVAYVMMTVRIGYYKIVHPYSFYAATLSVKTEDFNYETMCRGPQAVKDEMRRLSELGAEATAKDKAAMTVLELVNEMYARGLRFAKLNLYEADAAKFKVTTDGLMPPLCSVQGLGESVAKNIVEARENGEFFTVEDFRERTKANKTVVELLKKNGVLEGMPETNQLSLF